MSMLWRKPPPETRKTHGWAETDMSELGMLGEGPYGTSGGRLNPYLVMNEVLVFPIRLLVWIAKLLIWAFARLKSVLSAVRD